MNGVKRAMVVIDMPFGSYQGNPYEAVTNAVRMMKEHRPTVSSWKEEKKYCHPSRQY